MPAAAIEVEAKSRSTKQNALFTIPLLRAMNTALSDHPVEGEDWRAGRRLKRVIIVTSWYHSRRALHCFRHYAPDIQFYSRPSYFAYERSHWRPEGMRGYLRAEYVKLAGYWVCYGV